MKREEPELPAGKIFLVNVDSATVVVVPSVDLIDVPLFPEKVVCIHAYTPLGLLKYKSDPQPTSFLIKVTAKELYVTWEDEPK